MLFKTSDLTGRTGEEKLSRHVKNPITPMAHPNSCPLDGNGSNDRTCSFSPNWYPPALLTFSLRFYQARSLLPLTDTPPSSESRTPPPRHENPAVRGAHGPERRCWCYLSESSGWLGNIASVSSCFSFLFTSRPHGI